MQETQKITMFADNSTFAKDNPPTDRRQTETDRNSQQIEENVSEKDRKDKDGQTRTGGRELKEAIETLNAASADMKVPGGLVMQRWEVW